MKPCPGDREGRRWYEEEFSREIDRDLALLPWVLVAFVALAICLTGCAPILGRCGLIPIGSEGTASCGTPAPTPTPRPMPPGPLCPTDPSDLVYHCACWVWDRDGWFERVCPFPTATPTPIQPTPAVPQPADFRASIVASCQEMHYTEVVGGEWKGKCDSTIRYAGTLRSTGQFIRSTCDRDHWVCAADPASCPGIDFAEMEAHRKTFELCGGNEWWTPQGTVFHVSGAHRVEVDRKNNYQVWIWGAPNDNGISLYACLPQGARRDDGVLIPVDGEACGADHLVAFEAPK